MVPKLVVPSDPKLASLERTGAGRNTGRWYLRSKAVDSIVEHADIISEGKSRATDEASTETEKSFAPPEEDRAEGEA